MGTFILRPTADYPGSGVGWVASAGSMFSCVSDQSDATWIRNNTSPNLSQGFDFADNSGSLPTGAQITNVAMWMRARQSPVDSTSQIGMRMRQHSFAQFYEGITRLPGGTAIRDYQMGAYGRAPNGRPWNMGELNNTFITVGQNSTTSDKHRIYEIWLVVTYNERPVVTVTAPTGLLITQTPEHTWDVVDPEGNAIGNTRLRVFTDAVATGVNFNPDSSPFVYEAVIPGDVRSHITTTPIPPGTYRTYVRVADAPGAVSAWAGSAAAYTIQAQKPGTPVVVSATPDDATGSVTLVIQDTSNLMSAMQSSAQEASEPVDVTPINSTVTRNTSVGSDDTNSYQIQATANGSTGLLFPFNRVPPSKELTVRTKVRTAATSRTMTLRVTWYDSAWASISNNTTSASDQVGIWVNLVITTTTPANATWAKVEVFSNTAVAGEIHYVDQTGTMIRSTDWTFGGFASQNGMFGSIATVETGSSLLVAGANTTRTAVASSGTGAQGQWMHRLTATGAGSITASTPQVNIADLWNIGPGSISVMTQARYLITGGAYILNGTATIISPPRLTLNFYDASGTTIIFSVTAAGNIYNTLNWIQSTVTADISEFVSREFAQVDLQFTFDNLGAGEFVNIDMVGLNPGTDTLWRMSSQRSQRPFWVVPQIEYSDDGGTTWAWVAGHRTYEWPLYDQVTREATFVDDTLVSGVARQYRVYTYAFGREDGIFASDPSLVTAALTVNPGGGGVNGSWQLKDVGDPSANLTLPVRYMREFPTQQLQSVGVFQPLGRPRPVVITDGFKGDVLTLPLILNKIGLDALKALIVDNPRTLWLQSPFVGYGWWVRPSGELTKNILMAVDCTGNQGVLVDLPLIEVDSPE